MASTVTNLQSGSLERRREGVYVQTKEQQFDTSILRLRQNSSDIFVYDGRIVQDNFFDENLVDQDTAGAITTAPSPYAEQRTLGQSSHSENVFTEMTDFDPIVYINDEGLAMYPVILTAAGYADPIVDDGSVGVFETRSEIAGVRFLPAFAKRGLKASICSTAEGVDRKSYVIEQELPREFSSEYEKYSKYFEVGDQDTSILEPITYQDQDSSQVKPFIDSYDNFEFASEYPTDSAIRKMVLSGSAGSPYLKREKISSSAGWTFLNVSNGTDSIVYSDRI